MKKALILTYSGFQDQEVVYPFYRLKGSGFEVDIVSDKYDENGRFYGILGVNMPCSVTYKDFEKSVENFHENYDFLVLPGGVKALEKLRQLDFVIKFIKDWNKTEKVIASTCHGAQLLISAGITKGREITGYPSLKDDLVNSGAIYSEREFLIDKNIISSPHYDHMGIWMEKSLEIYHKYRLKV